MPVGYIHVPEGCVHGSNINYYNDLSIQECAVICNNNPLCLGFEYGVDHGSTAGDAYGARDCTTQNSADYENCDGARFNLDFYLKSRNYIKKLSLQNYCLKRLADIRRTLNDNSIF